MEVGANDGQTGDPLYSLIRTRRSGRALLIEPLPHLFAKLKAAYADCDHCTLANVAIAPAATRTPIYYIASEARTSLPALPAFFEELASFDRSGIAGILGEEGASFLRSVEVETIPLRDVLAKHGFEHVDLLQIDTEGFDLEVLKTFPFDRMLPTLVCFEHCHLSPSDRATARQVMENYGYRIEGWGKDYVCVRSGRAATAAVAVSA